MATKTKEKPKKKPARKVRPPRPKQPPLAEDWGPPSFPDVEDAAEAYDAVKTSRMELTKEEVTKKDTLARVMKERDLTTYKTRHGIVCTRDITENVKTSRGKGANGDGE